MRDPLQKADFPALRGLGLAEPEFEVLRRSGYLQADQRSATGPAYWRLRFRLNHQMRTVYLGQAADLIQRVQAELTQLQARKRAKSKLTKMLRTARAQRKLARNRLECLLLAEGLHLHGLVIRQRRSAAQSQTQGGMEHADKF